MNNVIGLLFDMNVLYEKVVFRLLKRHKIQYQQYQLKLASQYSKKFWSSRTIRPDIMGEYCSPTNQKLKRFIIDTKWKRPYDGNPSDDDLKQMFDEDGKIRNDAGVELLDSLLEEKMESV